MTQPLNVTDGTPFNLGGNPEFGTRFAAFAPHAIKAQLAVIAEMVAAERLRHAFMTPESNRDPGSTSVSMCVLPKGLNAAAWRALPTDPPLGWLSVKLLDQRLGTTPVRQGSLRLGGLSARMEKRGQ